MKRYFIPILMALLVLASGLFVGCSGVPSLGQKSAQTPTTEEIPKPTPETYIYIRGAVVVGGDGEPIKLINNPIATNPTYAELLAFIKRDQTDKYSYIFGPPKVAYTCGDFAEDVHNNAEAAGIRAAWVGIDIYGNTEGHALNAFETTDMGLVYIDCTGKGLWSESSSNRNSWDKRAHVKIGKAYQVEDVNSLQSGFNFLVGIEEYIDEVIKSKEFELQSPKIIAWLQKHDIKELGQQWIREWMRKHETELSRCGRVLGPDGNYGAQSYLDKSDNSYFVGQGWLVRTDCVEAPWFQPQAEVIDVDGMPVTWKVSWWSGISGFKSLGSVTNIHINW